MPSRTTLEQVFTRFDGWLAKKSSRARLFNAPASPEKIALAEKKIRAKFPASLHALYTWRDGETSESTIFETTFREDFEVQWEAYSEEDLEIRFMSLAETMRAGAFDAHFDEKGGCVVGPTTDPGARTKLVPFLWLRERGGGGLQANEDDDREPWDHDWLVAVDTKEERVWLFEVANEGLEGTFEQGKALAPWLERAVAKLEAGIVPTDTELPGPPESMRGRVEPPSELLLRLLVEKRLIELADGMTPRDVAPRIVPLLSHKPEKRAIRDVLAFFDDDDDIAEVYADDDMLKAIVAEFLD